MPRKARPKWQVAFNAKTGHHQVYGRYDYRVVGKPGEPDYERVRVAPEYRDPYEFEATLTYVGLHKAKSTLAFVWEAEDGVQYQMLLSGLDDAIEQIQNGVLVGRFGFENQGGNTGLKLLK